MSSDSTDATALAEKIVAAASQNRGDEPSPELREAIAPLFHAEPELREALRLRCAERIPLITSATGAGITAACLGSQVENGADAGESFAPIFSAFLRWARTLPAEPEPESDDAKTPSTPLDLAPHQDTLRGLEALGTSLVSHLARGPELKALIAPGSESVAHLYKVEHLSYGIMWVLTMLRQCSADLIVLHATEEKGVLVRYENIANCFHLFTLLQGVLAGVMPGARTPSPEALAAAKDPQSGKIPDSAWWHYGQPEFPKPDLMSSVFGEMPPHSITAIDGQQVMLLWPPLMEHRGWDSSFFTPKLEMSLPSVYLKRELTSPEITHWRTRLQLPEITRKPFWKFWG